jgi:type II secretory pathway component GspD/PulD (secretin)
VGEGGYVKKIIAAAVLFPTLAFSAPLSFTFNDVSLLQFSQATFKNVLHADYVISPDVLSMDRKITLSVTNVEESRVREFVEGILQQQGIVIEQRGAVFYLLPLQKVAASVAPARESIPTQAAPVVSPVQPIEPPVPVETDLYVAVNRPSDFLTAVVVGAFGEKKAVSVAGGVMLAGSADDVGRMKKLLAMVDSLPRLVDVSASWVEVADSASDGRGISLAANVLGAKFGVKLGSVSSGSALSVSSSSFELVIDALKTDGRFKQVSNSRLVGDDYEKLSLSVGDETPTVGSTGRDNTGNAVQNIVYRPSGVIVDVLPKVLGNGRIQLHVDGQISNFKSTVTGVTGSPTLVKRQVKTQVTVGDGEVILIGGLNDQQTSRGSSAFSFFPSWAAKSSSSSATDLVLVLSAKVVKQ